MVGLFEKINLEDGRVASQSRLSVTKTDHLSSDLCLPSVVCKAKGGHLLFTQAILTHPVDTNFYIFDHAREGALHGLQVYIQALGG